MKLRPQPGPQTKFAACPADVALFASMPGSGKSYSLILEALRWHDKANYTGVLMRAEYKDLMRGPTSLWGHTSRLGRQMGGAPRQSPHPSVQFQTKDGGQSSVLLLHGNTDKTTFDGLEIGFLGLDEMDHFDKDLVNYIMSSRMRTMSGIRPYVRGSVMPSPDSWIHLLAKPWLDSEGYAKDEDSGKVRWYFEDDRGLPQIYDTLEDAKDAAAVVDEAIRPRSLSFIFAKTTDNVALMKADPGYLDRLSNLSAYERKRLLHACWNARPETAGFFDRTWMQPRERPPLPKEIVLSARGWDFAASKPTAEEPNPDWTRGVRLDVLRDKHVVISDMVSRRDRPEPVNELLRATVQADGPRVTQSFAIDPGAAGLRDEASIRAMLSKVPGCGPLVFVRAVNKQTQARPWSSYMQAGKNGTGPGMSYCVAAWTGEYLAEIEKFPSPDKKVKDDCVDATSHAFRDLETHLVGTGISSATMALLAVSR